jgi:bifunctional DNA-binding transcriptional regulator/antitoxin component of YhaV-PrlF toxin-antitoxin module
MSRFVLKVRKKGVLILPKALRKAIGINEGEVVAEAEENMIIIKPLKPKVVKIDRRVVEELLSEEKRLEEEKFREIFGKIRG